MRDEQNRLLKLNIIINNNILPIIKLLVSSFYLQFIYLCLYRDITNPCSLNFFTFYLQAVNPSWHLSTHSLSFSSVGDKSVAFALLFIYHHKIYHPFHHSMYTLFHPFQILPLRCLYFLILHPSVCLRLNLSHYF